jgi:hypothetical protein
MRLLIIKIKLFALINSLILKLNYNDILNYFSIILFSTLLIILAFIRLKIFN